MRETIRTVAATGVAAVAVAVGALPAGADPLGQCPVPFVLGGLTGPVSIAADQNGNNDGYVCRLPFRGGAHEGSNNIIDNVVPFAARLP